MKQINFTDWQEFSLKKDIEKISKQVEKGKKAFYCFVWEALVFFFTLFLDHFFEISSSESNCSLFLVWILLALSPLILLVFSVPIKLSIQLKKAKKGIVLTKDYVDIFDNQICYWVMTGRSYYETITKTRDVSEVIFCYQEASYYINKAIFELYKMLPIITKVFSDEVDEVKKGKVISISRLVNVIQLILDFKPQIEVRDDNGEIFINSNGIILKGQIGHKKIIQFQKEIDKKYRENLSIFLEQINTFFSKDESSNIGNIMEGFIRMLGQ